MHLSEQKNRIQKSVKILMPKKAEFLCCCKSLIACIHVNQTTIFPLALKDNSDAAYPVNIWSQTNDYRTAQL